MSYRRSSIGSVTPVTVARTPAYASDRAVAEALQSRLQGGRRVNSENLGPRVDSPIVERQSAFALADELVLALDPGAARLLRPAIAQTLEAIQAPDAQLVTRPPLRAYLLCPPGLFVLEIQPEPPGVHLDWVNLEETAISMQSHDLRELPGGVWWETTWRLEYRDVSAVLVGREGPPHSRDELAQFGRAVALAAGWRIVPLPPAS